MSEEVPASTVQEAAQTQTRWLDAYYALEATLPRPTPTSSDASRLRGLIDRELADIRFILSAMSERRNEIALPSLLPHEVLALVFSFLAIISPISIFKYDYYLKRRLGWVSVTHVCRHWRKVCLSQPSLWTHLTPDQNQPWNVFLERAKEASLFIEGPFNSLRDGGPCIQPILDHRHHIQELTLSEMHASQLEELVDGLNGSLHRLRVLSLSRSSQTRALSPSLPTGFLLNSAPNIRQLTLFGVLFPWGEGSSKITKFVYQHGADSYGHMSHAHTFADVAQTLRQMPGLKTLKLVDALPDPAAQSNTEVIRLPFLRELSIQSDNDSCWYLWSHLRPPSSVHLDIHGTRLTDEESFIASTLQSYLQTCPHPAFSSMSVQLPSFVSGFVSFTLSGAQARYEQTYELHSSGRYFLHPSITLRVCSSAPVDLAKQLIAEVPLENIYNLRYGGGRSVDNQDFYEIFLPARWVVNLTLTKGVTKSTLNALAHTPTLVSSLIENTSSVPDDETLFPGLLSLKCMAINFAERIPNSEPSLYMHDVFDSVLGRRIDSGSMFETLFIEECDVYARWVEGWEEVVDEVDWDHDEGALAEPEDSEEDDE